MNHCWHLEPSGQPGYLCCFCGVAATATNATPPDGHGRFNPDRKLVFGPPKDDVCLTRARGAK